MAKQQKKTDHPTDKSPKTQPASPKFYAILSLIAFLLGGLLLFMFVRYAGNPNTGPYLFFVLLLPMGAAAGAFLFGAMRSYAAYRGEAFNGWLELGGPVVVFALVVIGGHYLPKETGPFDMTVFVNDTAGKPVTQGTVILDLDGNRRPEAIDTKGAAHFVGVPAKFFQKAVPVKIDIKGYELAKPGEMYVLKPGGVYLEVKRDDRLAKIAGNVKNAGGDFLKGVTIRVGKLKTQTDADGYFELDIPPEAQKEQQKLIARLDGYETWEGNVYPGTKQDVGIVMAEKGVE